MLPIPSPQRLIRGAQHPDARAGLLLAVALALPIGGVARAAAPSLEVAVAEARLAATSVLERAGAETCLRGKLTRALLGLSASCEAAGSRNALCDLADRAAVVTPMSLEFMDGTSRELLQLSRPAATTTAASAPTP